MADRVFVQCPHCKEELLEGRDYSGKLAECPFCGRTVPPPMPNAGPVADAIAAVVEAAVSGPAEFDYPQVELNGLAIAPEVLAKVPEQLAREKSVLPLWLQEGVLTVAMPWPPSPEMVDNLRFLANHPITVALASKESLDAALERCYPSGDAKDEPKAETKPEAAAPGYVRKRWVEGTPETTRFDKMLEPDNEAVTRMVQTILRDAFQLGASRVLVLPFKDRVKVGYRIQQAVYARDDLPPEMLYAILCTLMTMTDLSGFIKVSIAKRERQVHVAFQATQYGVSALVEIDPDTSVSEAGRVKAAQLGYSFVDLEGMEIPRSVLNLIPEALARKNRVIPLEFDGEKVTLVMGSPRDPEALDRLRFALNRPIVVTIANEGAIVAALERFYGPSDPETSDLVRKELEQTLEAGPGVAVANPAAAAAVASHPAARPFMEYLGTLYREPMLQMFEEIRASDVLCQADPATGDLAVVFPHTHIMSQMPSTAQRYIDNKIWVFREAIISRLGSFLERDPLARGLAETYALYLACRQLAEGQPTSINPACMQDAWFNCLYALLIRWFPALNTNGLLAKFLAEHADEVSAKVAALLGNPALVFDPEAVRPWFARLESQTILDEPVGCNSPWIANLLELLLAEATRGRASHLLLLPREDGIEVAYRVQKAVYGRERLSSCLLLPLVARIRSLIDQNDTMEVIVDGRPCRARVRFLRVSAGIATRIDLPPDRAAIAACQEAATAAGCRMIDLSEVDVPAKLLALAPKSAVWKKRVLPVSVDGNQLTVAISRPPTPRQTAELKLLFRRAVSVALAPEEALIAAIYRHYHPITSAPAASQTAVALLEQAAREMAQAAPTRSSSDGEGHVPGGSRILQRPPQT